MKKLASHFLIACMALSLAAPALVPITAQAQATSPSCHSFAQSLGIGRPLSAQDAAALAQALADAGVWKAGTPITAFDDSVASAISGFQEKYASDILAPNGLSYGTGYVGAATRAKLNSLYGCQTTQPSQAIQCPAGYTCTPIGQPAAPVCPTGFICTPIKNTVAASSPSLFVYPPLKVPVLGKDTGIGSTSPSAMVSSAPLPFAPGVSGASTSPVLGLSVLGFNVQATGDTIHLHSVTVSFTNSSGNGGGNPGSITTAYLYQGSTLIASMPVSAAGGSTAVFNISDGMQAATIPMNAIMPFTIKVDISPVTGFEAVTASIMPGGVTVYDSHGTAVPVNGYANNGNGIIIQNN